MSARRPRLPPVLAALLFALAAVACGPAPIETPASGLVIANATLIDGTGAAPRANVDVLVRAGRIEAIGTGLDPAGAATRLDAAGKVVVPGLIDTHVHLDAPMVFQLTASERDQILAHTPRAFLYNGVTTVLNLSSDAEWIWRVRDDQRAGRLLAPRILATGRGFTPPNGWGSRHGDTVDGVAQASARVERYAARGADGIKLTIEDGLGASGTYVVMPQDVREAVAASARAAGLPLFVHAINLAEYREAVALTPRAIVHGIEDPLPDGDPLPDALRTEGIFVVPTISLFEAFTRFDGQTGWWDDPVLASSVPPFLIAHMRDPSYLAEEKARFRAVARIEVYDWAARALPIFKATTLAFHRAGVRLAVGTDAGGPVGYNFQGYNTPREVELLVDIGLTPMAALVAATRTGAELIGRADDLGTLEVGKRADLLVLSANPLDDIRHLRRIEHVMLDGVLHARETLAAGPPR
jgi:imidazolonepropionase-like amidohydrolase